MSSYHHLYRYHPHFKDLLLLLHWGHGEDRRRWWQRDGMERAFLVVRCGFDENPHFPFSHLLILWIIPLVCLIKMTDTQWRAFSRGRSWGSVMNVGQVIIMITSGRTRKYYYYESKLLKKGRRVGWPALVSRWTYSRHGLRDHFEQFNNYHTVDERDLNYSGRIIRWSLVVARATAELRPRRSAAWTNIKRATRKVRVTGKFDVKFPRFSLMLLNIVVVYG